MWTAGGGDRTAEAGQKRASKGRSEVQVSMAGLGSPQDLLIILVVALLVFGPKKLPEIGHSIGKALRELRKASGDFMDAFHSSDLNLTDTSPAPAPVHYPDYTSVPAAGSAERYEMLPYGADFAPATDTAHNGSSAVAAEPPHGAVATTAEAPHLPAAAAASPAEAPHPVGTTPTPHEPAPPSHP